MRMFSKNLVIVLVLLLGAGIFFATRQSNESQEQVPAATPSPVVTPNEVLVQIGINGFSPMDFNVKVGGKVTFENSDKIDHEIASAVHPTHKLFPILNIGLLKPGEKKTIQFDIPGTYTYHDHLTPQFTGSFIVVP